MYETKKMWDLLLEKIYFYDFPNFSLFEAKNANSHYG